MKNQGTYLKIARLIRYISIFLAVMYCHISLATPVNVTISCSDTDQDNSITPAECIVDGAESVSLDLINLTVDLIGVVSPDATCDLAKGNCAIGNLDCTQPAGAGSLECSLKNAPELFNVSCSSSSCTIVSDTDFVTNQLTELSIPINQNLLALGQSLAGCIHQYSINDNVLANNAQKGLQEVCELFFTNLENNPEQAVALLKALQPINPDASSDLSAASLKLSLNTIQGRLSRLRNGISDTNQSQNHLLYVNNEWLNAGTLLADNATTANDAASQNITVDRNISEYGKLGVFINASILNADQTNNDVELESDSRSSVLTLGIDYRFTDALIAGLAFNINQSKTEFDDKFTSGTLDSDGYSMLVYGSYYQGNWFFDSSITLGADEYEQERTPALPLDNSYLANFHGSQQSLSGTAGYDFLLQSFTITPFAQLIYGSIDTDGYRESVKNPLLSNVPIGFDQHSKDIGTINIGSHFRYIVNTDHGVFIPSISLTAVNDFEDDAQSITGYFVANANPADSFALETNKLDSSYFVIGLGFSFQLKAGNAGFVNLESVEGYDQLNQQRLTAGWRWEI